MVNATRSTRSQSSKYQNLKIAKSPKKSGSKKLAKPISKSVGKSSKQTSLDAKLLLRMHDFMVKARCLEERLIRMYKQNDGYFWIGGPGEEAFNVPLGMLVNKGQGVEHDYLHLHYRSSATLVAMGMEPIDAMRQMKNTATDPFSGGRNFCGHTSISKWNVAPISSPIEIQYVMAPGTARAQKRHGGKGITIVTGGDAGTAEGDFASCLVWSSRAGHELPVLILVTNNHWGISTPFEGQHGEKYIADRGKAFGMRTAVIDGCDPEAAYIALRDAMEYVRRERKPFLMEAMVSRLYGHSSASGANFVTNETDPLKVFETKLLKAGLLNPTKIENIWKNYNDSMALEAKKVRGEAQPSGDSIWDHVFANQTGKKDLLW